jgi:hypothetical protein
MAYCVRCGVKLQDGAKVCPLCGTKVILPEGMHEKPEKPLFPKDTVHSYERGLDRTRKALFEIAAIITVVAEVVVGFSILPDPDAFLPMIGILYAAVVFLIPVLVEKPSYVTIGSLEMVATAILLVLVNLYLSSDLTWSLVASGSLALIWVLSVPPILLKKHTWIAILIQIAGVCGFLFLIDGLYPPFGWTLKVGLPTFAFMLAMVGLFLIRLRLKIFTKASVVDYVFSGFSIICLSIGFGDLAFHQFNGISWSEPLWICGITLFVLELLIAGVRKIRTFFNARNGRQG